MEAKVLTYINLDDALTSNGWTKCADQLPAQNELVHVFMCYSDHNESTKAVYTARGWSKDFTRQPTHWKPVFNNKEAKEVK